MIACRLLGHRLYFQAHGEVMRWECERGCGFVGEKHYDGPADACRYAHAFNRRDGETVGRRFSPSLLPLWLGRRGAGTPSARSRRA